MSDRRHRKWIGMLAAAVALSLGASSAWAASTPQAHYCPDDQTLTLPPGQAMAALDIGNASDLPSTVTLKIEVATTSATLYKKVLSTRGHSQGKGNQGDGTNVILIGSESSTTETFTDVGRLGGGNGATVLEDLDLEELVGEGEGASHGPNPHSGFEPVGTVNIGDATQVTLYILKGDQWVLLDLDESCD